MTSADESGEDRLDPAVVAALYVEHAEELRTFLTGLLRSRDLAAEALQATFARAVEVGHTSREETRKGWLFKVAYNEAMAIRRRQKVHQKSVEKLSRTHSRSGERPEESLTRWETVALVREALESLPPEQQQVVRMRIYEEKTFARIAEETGAPLGTVLTRMRLALKKIEDQLRSKP